MVDEADVDKSLIEVLREADLLNFQTKLIFDKQLTRIEHFQDVSNAEFKSYGLSEPAIRRLRKAIELQRKRNNKMFTGAKAVKTIRLKRDACVVTKNIELFPQQQLIPRNELKLMETLGEGNFSIVKRAIWTHPDGTKIDCAVKILHDMSESVRQDLATEIATMQRLRHQNIVQLFGVVFDDRILMVIEFCEGGSLLNRLRDQSKPRLMVTTLLNYLQQIANGMSYLESRSCLHRDLAARNALLAQDEQLIKLCDFGLTRVLNENEHLYVMSEPKKIPFAWSPPESLKFREFSHKSDVWAFGVCCWELYTFGEEPWAGYRAAEVLHNIEAGQRLNKPLYCSQEIYDIMLMCWNKEAEERPKFSQLRKLLMDVKFMVMACRAKNDKTSNQLNLSIGDEVVLIGQRDDDIWFGQSLVNRYFGEFPRHCVSIKPTMQSVTNNEQHCLPNSSQRTDISVPIAGSFIHTGHGDLNHHRCWGHVDHIDEIYLKNPLVSNSIPVSERKVTIIPSILMINQNAELAVSKSQIDESEESSSTDKKNSESACPNYSIQTCLNRLDDRSYSAINDIAPSLLELQRRSVPICDSDESFQLYSNMKSSNEVESIAPIPPPQKSSRSSGNNGNYSANAKYDSAISIPRPFRTYPLRVDHMSSGEIFDRHPSTVPQSIVPKLTNVSSLPSVYSDMPEDTLKNTGNELLPKTTHRPTSTHSLCGEYSSKYNDDPFVIKEDIKMLSEKPSYGFLKSDEFNSKTCTAQPVLPIQKQKPQLNLNQLMERHQNSNVAVVFPLVNATPTPIKETDRTIPSTQSTSSSSSPFIGNLSSKTTTSFLPPPSDLLLSGFTTCRKDLSTEHYKPLFDISGHNIQTNNLSRLRNGTNGIPILEPTSQSNGFARSNDYTTAIQHQNSEAPKRAAVTLNDLNTDAMLNRVKTNVDFASYEQCRQSLWRTGFDVESAIKQLKIEKLLEMGLAADRELAASALDSEQWDVNAAANRLCCS